MKGKRKCLIAGFLAGILFLLAAGCGRADMKPDGTAENISARADVSPNGSQKDQTRVCPSRNGALHVEDARLTDENGTPVQLRGISTHGLAWFPQYVNEDCFRQLAREWDVNVIRLAMYTAESGGYCTDGDQEELKELIRKGVSYAAAQDLYVIVDWHVLSDQDPNRYREEAVDFFREMSAEFADMDHVLYEVCNEPNGDVGWAQIRDYAAEVIGVIRAQDEDAVVIVGTPNWSQFVDEAAADPITDYENVMYALHYYAATHKEDLRRRMAGAIESGLPVFVTEYGICDASGNGAIDEEEANRWMETLNAYGVSHVAWNLSNKNETSALLSPACSRTSGFTQEDLSDSGKWLYRMLTGSPVNAQKTETGQGFVSNGMRVTMEAVNSWEAADGRFTQYQVTLENVSGAAMAGWTIEIPFAGEVCLGDGWNGEYAVSGKTLTISSKEYNAAVDAGAYVTEIGFILSED